VQQGQEEGQKDRPCAVVVALADKDGGTGVYALAITHSAPTEGQGAIEIPQPVKARLGLDGERSWIVVDEANVFSWPGPYLRFVPGKGAESAAYGFLPPGFFRLLRDHFLESARAQKSALVARTEYPRPADPTLHSF